MAQGRDYLQRMHAAAGRMQRLIQALLAYSRVGTKGELFERVSLERIIQDVLQNLTVRIEQTGAQVHCGASIPEIDADPTQMLQLFQNLIGNALKFHQPGAAPRVRINASLDDQDMVEITVSDAGIGFDEKYLDRIFAPFERLHGRAEYEGTGIGLAICRKIVERHGGTLTARSMPGEGAKFIVTLPRRQPNVENVTV